MGFNRFFYLKLIVVKLVCILSVFLQINIIAITLGRRDEMDISNKQYDKMVKNASPKSPVLKDCVKAFLIGGAICCFGQLLFMLYSKLGLSTDESRSLVSISLIAITAILTGFGIFDKIAKHAGAGTIVPITGFANSVVSPALEFKSEGFVMGTGASIFKIAGPVILYGTTAASVYGIIYFIMEKVMK